MQDFIFLYIKPIRGENTPYIYRANFEESGPSTHKPRDSRDKCKTTKAIPYRRCKTPKAPPTLPSLTSHRRYNAHQGHVFRTPKAKPLTTGPSLSPRYRWNVSSLHTTGNIATCDIQRNHIRQATKAPHIRNPPREQEMKFTMQFANAYFGIRSGPNTKQKRCKKQSLTPL